MFNTVDALVIGGGISGLVTAKCFLDVGFKTLLLERSNDIGGLWNFRENEYGVMKCTYINVSKQNYSFSDFPFPEETPDFPHHSVMASYIKDYAKHFGLYEVIKFKAEVKCVKKKGDAWEVNYVVYSDDGENSEEKTIECKYLAVATGHHALPKNPPFPDEEKFKGKIIHSVNYKSSEINGTVGKRVLVIGIGNSAVDVAVDQVTNGRNKKTYLSTRSGAWVLNNYLMDRPVDHYACRALFYIPWRISTFILEWMTKLTFGDPFRWNLNPKMRALQTQPTVSPTMYYHIRRGNIDVKPNVSKFTENGVIFEDGSLVDFDYVVKCTGYTIGLPFLEESISSKILNRDTNVISLYKNVFSPSIGHTLGFIGFVQPASGGILMMAETQARWMAELCKGRCKLPPKYLMDEDIDLSRDKQIERYYNSTRHTIQEDPIPYCDDIAKQFGAAPTIWKHPRIAWNLLMSTCGSAQYRLEGPGVWLGAEEAVRNVKPTSFFHYGAIVLLIIVVFVLFGLIRALLSLF